MMRKPVGMVEFDLAKLYPLLQYFELKLNARRDYTLTGTYKFDESRYWRFAVTGTFKYPYEQPQLIDLSYPQYHNEQFHMSDKGFCCVEEPYLMQSEALKGIRLSAYIMNYVLPFYANLEHRIIFGHYRKEWSHREHGLIEARHIRYCIDDRNNFKKAVRAIENGEVFTANSRCFCGERRISKQHFQLIKDLRNLHPLIWRKLLLEKSSSWKLP